MVPSEGATVELRFMIGRVLASMELDSASSVAVQRTLQLGEPEDPFWKVRVQALATRRDPTRSCGLIEELHRSYPKDLDLTLDLALVLTQAQRGAEAEQILLAVLPTAASERDRLRVELTRLIVAERQSRWTDIKERYPALLDRIHALGAPGLELWAMRSVCSLLAEQGARESAERACTSLGELATAQRLPGSLALALVAQVSPRIAMSIDEAALALTVQGAALVSQVGGRRRLAEALNNVAILKTEKEGLAQGRPVFEEALAMARTAHDHQTVIAILGNFGYYEAQDGHLEAEARYLREGLELARDTKSREALAYALCRLALTELRLGEVRAARELSSEARRLGAGSQDTDGVRECRVSDAQALELDGDFVAADQAFHAIVAADQALHRAELALEDQKNRCESLLFAEDDRGALRCIDVGLTMPTADNSAAADERLLTMRALALARLGRMPEARALEERMRDKIGKSDPIYGGGWSMVELVNAQRLLGRPTSEISPALERVISGAALAQDRWLEAYARLELVALHQRDHAPQGKDEARTLLEFATRYGYVWLGGQAQRLAGSSGH